MLIKLQHNDRSSLLWTYILADQKKLPPAFKKKLAEWEIRKAVAGKSDQNVEELQKILPLDFNRKLQEWERIKAAAVNKPASPGTERQHHQQHQYHQVITSYFIAKLLAE